MSYELELYDLTEAAGYGIVSVGDVLRNRAPLSPAIPIAGRTTYNWDAADPLLEVGHEYLVRVRAIDLAGDSRFGNRGYSLPVRFTLGAPATGDTRCPAPSPLTLDYTTLQTAGFSWAPPPPAAPAYQSVAFQLTHEVSGQARDFAVDAGRTLTADGLSADAAYTFEARAYCVDGTRSAPVSGTFRTSGPRAQNDEVIGCGETPPPVEATVGEALAVGSVVDMGGIPLALISGTGSGGGFTGEGTVKIPWLEQGTVHVRVVGLGVDAAGRWNAGTVEALRSETVADFDPTRYAALFGDRTCGGDYAELEVDEFGFTADGVHYVTGDAADPNGFNRDGDYVGPGATAPPTPMNPDGFNRDGDYVGPGATVPPGRYDPNGCDADGYRASGIPCDGGGNGGAIVRQGVDFYADPDSGFVENAGDFVTDNFVPPGLRDAVKRVRDLAAGSGLDAYALVRAAVVEAVAFHDADLAAQIETWREGFGETPEVVALSQNHHLERVQLFGIDDELLREGMSAYFPDGFPEQLSTAGRNPEVVAYEDYLADLYEADVRGREELLPLGDMAERFRIDLEIQEFAVSALLGALDEKTGPEVIAVLSTPQALRDFAREAILAEMRRRISGEPLDWGYFEWAPPARQRGVLAPDWEEAWASLDGGPLGWSAPATQDPPDYRSLLPPPSHDPLYGFKLPLRIRREVLGRTYNVVVDELTFAPGGAWSADLYAVLGLDEYPGEALVFHGEGIPFGAGGIGDSVALSLVSRLELGLGGIGTLVSPAVAPGATPSNFVVVDCEGFKSVHLGGELALCEELAERVDPATLAPYPEHDPTDKRVRLAVAARADRWPHFTFEVADADVGATGGANAGAGSNPQPFIVGGREGVVWGLGALVVDLSEHSTPEGRDGLEDYLSSSAFATTREQWRGVYVDELAATAVGLFEDRATGEKPGIAVDELVIDRLGVTAEAKVTNVLTLEEGEVGSWAVAIDEVDIALLASTWQRSGVKGRLRLPTDDGDVLGYEGQFGRGGDFGLAVEYAEGEIQWPMWAGEATLQQGCRFELGRVGDDWSAEAVLYGKFVLGDRPALERISVEGLEFSNLKLATQRPYVSLGADGFARALGMPPPVGLFGFEMELDRIRLVAPDASSPADASLGLFVGAALDLLPGPSGFGVGAGVTLWGGERAPGPGRRLGLKFVDYEVSDISLDVDIPACTIFGQLAWEQDDPVFGDGFHGKAVAKFDALGVGLAASATFGRTNYGRAEGADPYPYFAVDAVALFPDKAPLFIAPPSPLIITAVGGGLSYRMQRADPPGTPLEINFTSDPAPTDFGVTVTGIPLKPVDADVVGLRFAGGLGMSPAKEVFSADFVLSAELNFNQLSVQRVDLNGSGRFMSPPPALEKLGAAAAVAEEAADAVAPSSSEDAALVANLALSYERSGPDGGRVVSGQLEAFMRYPFVGPEVIVGAGPNNRVGQVDVYVDRSRWFLRVGEPDDRVSLKIKQLDALSIGTYLDIGTELPAPPVLPAGYPGLDFDIPNGRGGFMHGTEIAFDQSFNGVRVDWQADLSAAVGYNVLVTGGNTCSNRPNYGIKGWRLQGNAYLGASGTLKYKRMDLLSAGASAVVDVQGPNPFYVAGVANVLVDLPGKRFDFDEDVDFRYGELCTGTATSPSEDAGPIEKVLLVTTTTQDGETIAVDRLPAAFTAYPVGQRFDESWTDASGTLNIRQFKLEVNVEVSRVLSGGRRAPLPGGTSLSSDKGTVSWAPTDMKNFRPGGRYAVRYTAALKTYSTQQQTWVDFTYEGHTYGQTIETVVDVEAFDAPQLVAGFAPSADAELGVFDPLQLYVELDESVEVPHFDGTSTVYHPVASITMQRRGAPVAGSGDDYPYELLPVAMADSTYANGTLRLSPAQPYVPESVYFVNYAVRLRDAAGGRYEYALDQYHSEYATLEYTSGPAPTTFVEKNVRRSYPQDGQYNVHLEQPGTDAWFVDIGLPQDYLFAGTQEFGGGGSARIAVRYVDVASGAQADLVYVDAATLDGDGLRQLTWAKPAGLTPGRTYRQEIIRIGSAIDAAAFVAAQGGGGGSTNTGSTTANTATAGRIATGSSTQTAIRGAQTTRNATAGMQTVATMGTVVPEDFTVLHELRFRVSRYRTMAEKLTAYGIGALATSEVEGTRTPDYPATDFVWPAHPTTVLGEATCQQPLDHRKVARPEVRPLGHVSYRSSEQLAEPFGELEILGGEREVRTADGRGFEQIVYKPLLRMSDGDPLVDVTAYLSGADSDFVRAGLYQAGGFPDAYDTDAADGEGYVDVPVTPAEYKSSTSGGGGYTANTAVTTQVGQATGGQRVTTAPAFQIAAGVTPPSTYGQATGLTGATPTEQRASFRAATAPHVGVAAETDAAGATVTQISSGLPAEVRTAFVSLAPLQGRLWYHTRETSILGGVRASFEFYGDNGTHLNATALPTDAEVQAAEAYIRLAQTDPTTVDDARLPGGGISYGGLGDVPPVVTANRDRLCVERAAPRIVPGTDNVPAGAARWLPDTEFDLMYAGPTPRSGFLTTFTLTVQ